jgi:dTDP-4-amino-4,6-dideoxygalactose transaminase
MPISHRRFPFGGSIEDEAEFLKCMKERFGNTTSIIPLGRARTGIYLLAKKSVRPGRTKFLLSPFTIPDVVNMVHLAGCEPVFYDFEPQSTAIDINRFEKLIGEDTAAVMVTHYHVNEPHLHDIAAICQKYGSFLYDDCALAFGGSVDGKPIGTSSDASVFSFSAFKLINYFWGGMITTRDHMLAHSLREEVAAWPRLTARQYLRPFKACVKYDIASRPPVFDQLLFPIFLRHARTSGTARRLENARIESEFLDPTLTSRPALAALAEWVSKLARVDKWLTHRRYIASIYLEKLQPSMVTTTSATQNLIDGSCFMNFPVVVDVSHRNELCLMMMEAGFDVGGSLYPNCHRHPKFETIKGSSTNIDRLTRSIIYLPTHFGVSADYADVISSNLADLIGTVS